MYEQTTVAEIKERLLQLGKSQEDIDKIKGKSNFVYELMLLENESPKQLMEKIEELPDDNEFNETDNPILKEDRATRIKTTDPEWNDFVLSQFLPNELIDGKPTVVGLRRVAELLLGEVVSSRAVFVECSNNHDNVGRATVSYEVQIAYKRDVEAWVDLETYQYPIRVYGGVADAWAGNTDPQFAVYPAAMAETRAEGRALRKALKLNVITAEESTTQDVGDIVQRTLEPKASSDSNINMNQAAFIKLKCKSLSIDVDKLVQKYSYSVLEAVTKSDASKMIEQINNYQNGEEPIPEGLRS